MAFLGYIGEENVSAQDILDYAEQTDYWYYYPLLQNAAVVDAGGCEIYVIVPASEWSVFVYPSEMTEEAKYKDDLEAPYYEGSPDEVILLRCNISEIYSNVMVSVREGQYECYLSSGCLIKKTVTWQKSSAAMTSPFILMNVMAMDVMTLLSTTKRLRSHRMLTLFSARRMKLTTT